MRDLATQPANADTEKPPYSMQVLLEEVATLRVRVRELEDDHSSGPPETRTSPSLESADSGDSQETSATLRKQLNKAEQERAELEMHFMNQLASLERENQENLANLEKQLKMTQCEKNIIKANASFEQSDEVYELQQEVEKLKEVIASQGDGGAQQLVEKLNSTEKELERCRQEKESLKQSVEELDGQKTTLLEEITHLRIDHEKDTKTNAALREDIEHMQKEFDAQIEKYEADFIDQEETIQQHEESFGELHDNIVELEGQKALLLDEITGLRLQLERETKAKASMKTRIDELSKAVKEAGDYKLASMEERATAAEGNSSKLQDTINELQEELRKVTSSYKADVARLEERVAARDAQLDQQKLEVTRKATELTEAEEHNSSVNEELKELRTKMERYERETSEKEHEIATMVSQRISYEKRATRNIMDHVAEVDDLRAQVEELQGEVGSLKSKLREEQLAAAKLKSDNTFRSPPQAPAKPPNARTIPKRFHFSSPPPPPPPPSTPPQSQSLPRPCVTGTPPSLTKARLQPASPRTPRTSVSAGGTPKSQPWPQQFAAPGTPVQKMVEEFERMSNSSHGTASANQGAQDMPCVSHDTSQDVSGLQSPQEHNMSYRQNQCDSDISLSSAEADAFNRQLNSEPLQVRRLQEKLQKQSELVGELRAEIATLTATRGAMAVLAQKEHEQQAREDHQEIEHLNSELKQAKCDLEAETQLVNSLREELENSQQALEEYKQSTQKDHAEIERLNSELDKAKCDLEAETELVEALREELNILAMERVSYGDTAMEAARKECSKSVSNDKKEHAKEMNKLSNALTNAQMEKDKVEKDLKNKIKELEDTIETINAEIDEELAEKQKELDEMQRKLDEQLKTVDRLETENEQMCHNISNVSSAKKAEIDELQQELYDKSAEVSAQAREIEALKMQVQRKIADSADVERLKTKIGELEQRAARGDINQSDFDELNVENGTLKETIRKMTMERRTLQEKLSAVMADKSSSKTVQVLRERNAALKKEVERLTRRSMKQSRHGHAGSSVTTVGARIEI